MANEGDDSLPSLKNELQDWLKKLEKDYTFTEDGNLTEKGDNIGQESCLDEQTKITEKFIECLANILETLQKVTDVSVDSIKGKKIDAVCFLGKTGSGKSTLVQILGTDNTKMFSKEASTNQFIITDDRNIGTNNVISETLYPELVFDEESSYVLCDNPGFSDTRSSLHEIITMVAVWKFLQRINKIKIVIVCPQGSLGKDGDRSDFPNTLKYLSQLLKNVDKFKKSIYLDCSKVENTVMMTDDGGFGLIPDESIIDNITSFLLEVKSSMSDDDNVNILGENEFYNSAVKIIDGLLQKSDGIYDHISILRKPMRGGRISDNKMLQSQKDKIKQMLFTDNNFVKIGDEDFQMVLSEKALLFLNNIFNVLNSYITHLSTLISENIMKHYETIKKTVVEDNEIKAILRKLIHNISVLCASIDKCKNPKEYSDLIKEFSKENNFSLDFLPDFENLCLLNEHLSDLVNQSNVDKFSPSSWSVSIRDTLDSKLLLDRDNFLKDIYLKLSSYKIQKRRNRIISQNSEIFCEGSEICGNDVAKILEIIALPSKNNYLLNDDLFLSQLKPIINHTLNHKLRFDWLDQYWLDTVVIFDYFLLLSELRDVILSKCSLISKIIIFAMHTMFIDSDLSDDHFKGKQLVIIAPIWEVNGFRTINLDGSHGGPHMPKASSGQIGENGKSGSPGGKFLGIGIEFNDCKNLSITASGGNGQDGQDGGDGKDGKDGGKGTEAKHKKSEKEESSFITPFQTKVLKTVLLEGTKGEPGTNSGEGGKGGRGGIKGTVTVYDVGRKGHKISIVTNHGKPGNNGVNGTPGKGGKHGDIIKEESITRYVLFIPVSINSSSSDCRSAQRAADGKVIKRPIEVIQQLKASASTDYQCKNNRKELKNIEVVLDYLEKFKNIFVKNYSSTARDSSTNKFICDAVNYMNSI